MGIIPAEPVVMSEPVVIEAESGQIASFKPERVYESSMPEISESEAILASESSSSTPIECSCVAYARKLGANVRGDAKNIKPNSVPREGGVVI